MRIAALDVQLLDGGYLNSPLFQRRIASPMSRFPDLAERRALWMWPSRKVVASVRDEAGRTGIAVTNGGEMVATVLKQQFARLVVGRDAADIDTIWDIAFSAMLPFDRSGFVTMAVAALDIALWHLKAQDAGGLVAALGGAQHVSLPAYVTTTRPEAFAREPFAGFKIAIPYGPEAGAEGLAANVAAVAALRAAAGPVRDIAVDVFMAWDVDYTLRFAEAAAAHRLRWIEDPLPPTDLDAYVRLRERLAPGIALALGNFCFHRWDCAALLDAGVAGVLQPDVAWAGGITECRRIAALAASRGVPVILHNAGEQPWALALAATLPGPTEIELVDRGDGSLLNGLFADAPAVAGGRFEAAAAPPGWRLSPAAQARLVPA